jgi:hypothetical protein
MSDALEALRAVNFSYARTLESVWSGADPVIHGPNEKLAGKIIEQFHWETRTVTAQPVGCVVTGQSGIGKTHLVGNLRHRVWDSGGWFVLLDVVGLTDFWRSAALSFLTSLLQEMPGGRRQFEAVLAGVARKFKVESQVEEAFNTPSIEPRMIVDTLVKGLIKVDMANTLRHQDVFRALCLLRSIDVSAASLAHSWLQGYDADERARADLGFLKPPPAPVDLVRGMSWIMSLTGPTLVAVDQIDGIVNPSSITGQESDDLGGVPGLGEVLAAGLLELHDVRHRGMTIITCLLDSWRVLQERSLKPFLERFRDPLPMRGMNDASAVKDLIVSRLKPACEAAGFTPPFLSWPFTEKAIEGAASARLVPRIILMRCDAFRLKCLARNSVEVCDSLAEPPPPEPRSDPEGSLSTKLQSNRETADLTGLITPNDDEDMGRLLSDVFDLYVRQLDSNESVDVESRGDPAQRIPPLHGRVTFTYHDENDRERHFCFRALEHGHHISFQARLRAALTASGISTRIPGRHLAVIRRSPIPGGAKTRQLFDAFEKAGGVVINPSDDDLRTFIALRTMRDRAVESGNQGDFDTELRAAKPLLDTGFFKEAGLSPPPVSPSPSGSTPKEPTGETGGGGSAGGADAEAKRTGASMGEQAGGADSTAGASTEAEKPSHPAAIPVGHRMTVAQEPVELSTKLLQRHTAIIAGSGSGKTVLLRRIVEEAALTRIPAIVIDPNNDLSRLGDPWPERPAAFAADDDAKARRYMETIDVVVWTPGIHGGNPLFLSVMPDFASLGSDRDEREQAVAMAAETLGPLAGARNALQQGVLVEALRYFADAGGGDLARFTAVLESLPDGVSPIGNAERLAAKMADQLHAAVATNPLLRADGPVLDLHLLFFGRDPRRTRISVINLSGLGTDAAREDFVNRLQMTLFGWIKKHPSASGLLYVVDEAQTFFPSQKSNLSLNSGIRLAAQARKYGLGMIVATQAPKGINNQIVSNCRTQFFGLQNAPATIAAAQDIIAASGGRADDLGKLKAGEFYFKTEGSEKPGKIRTPLCLTFHPPNPPSPEEVIARAKRSR